MVTHQQEHAADQRSNRDQRDRELAEFISKPSRDPASDNAHGPHQKDKLESLSRHRGAGEVGGDAPVVQGDPHDDDGEWDCSLNDPACLGLLDSLALFDFGFVGNFRQHCQPDADQTSDRSHYEVQGLPSKKSDNAPPEEHVADHHRARDEGRC